MTTTTPEGTSMPPATCNCPARCGRPIGNGAGRAYGYAPPCYRRWRIAGKPASGPPPPRKAAPRVPDAIVRARIARLADLLAAGLTVAEAAHQLGVGLRAAEAYAQALRKQRREELAGSPIDWPQPAPPPPAVWHWSDRAACRGHGALFYGAEDERVTEKEIREDKAKSLCAVCPVRVECLADAEERCDKWGVRGGLTEAERAGGKRRREYDEYNARRVAARRDDSEAAA